MKYLMIQDGDGLEFPVFCLAPRTHAEMAKAWRRNDSSRVLSGGFVEFLPEGVRCFGFSSSLNLAPRERDARIIAAFYKAQLSTALGLESRMAAGIPQSQPVPA